MTETQPPRTPWDDIRQALGHPSPRVLFSTAVGLLFVTTTSKDTSVWWFSPATERWAAVNPQPRAKAPKSSQPTLFACVEEAVAP